MKRILSGSQWMLLDVALGFMLIDVESRKLIRLRVKCNDIIKRYRRGAYEQVVIAHKSSQTSRGQRLVKTKYIGLYLLRVLHDKDLLNDN